MQKNKWCNSPFVPKSGFFPSEYVIIQWRIVPLTWQRITETLLMSRFGSTSANLKISNDAIQHATPWSFSLNSYVHCLSRQQKRPLLLHICDRADFTMKFSVYIMGLRLTKSCLLFHQCISQTTLILWSRCWYTAVWRWKSFLRVHKGPREQQGYQEKLDKWYVCTQSWK